MCPAEKETGSAHCKTCPPVYDVQNQHKQVKKSYKIPRESLEHIVSFVVDEYMIQEDAFLVELYQQ